jgi:hypothetical protein
VTIDELGFDPVDAGTLDESGDCGACFAALSRGEDALGSMRLCSCGTPPRHLIAPAAITPSGVPPIPTTKSTPDSGVAAITPAATSPSVMSMLLFF